MYRPVDECFEVCDEIRPSHLLYEDFLQERKDVIKIAFYQWLYENELGAKHGKATDGNLGFGLKYIKTSKDNT